VLALLGQRDADEEQARNHLRLLEELAFHSRFCGKPLTHAFAENTATWLAKERDFGSPRDKAQRWLAKLEYWQLLARHDGGNDTIYEFAIPTLDEYFAARHLAVRWAEEDQRYWEWLPCSDGWWERRGQLRCPNPYCSVTWLPFRDLLQRVENQEVLLLMLGLLRDATREHLLVRGIADDVNLSLKALARCHHAHSATADEILCSVFPTPGISTQFADGLGNVGRARLDANLTAILDPCLSALRDPDTRWTAVYWLAPIGTAAVGSVITLLDDPDGHVRHAAASALGEIADEQAVEPLIIRLQDPDRWVRKASAYALGRLSDTHAVEPLVELLQDRYWDVRRAAAHSLGALGDVRAVPALQRMLDDNVHVRNTASQALLEIERRTRVGSV
jgi:hypothetical protein